MSASAIPSAREDLLGAIDALVQLGLELRERVAAIERRSATEGFYTIKDLEKRYGLSRRTLTDKPWLLPNFGKADFGASPKRWYKPTVEAWEACPVIEHRRAWELMSAEQKREALGIEESA